MPQLSSRDAESVEETQGLLNSPAVNEEETSRETAPEMGAEEKPLTHNTIVIPTLQKTGITHGSMTSKQAPIETSLNLCRICLEEDTAGNLESPCGCAGTQRWAHRACIQRWVTEKGNLKCEVCGQEYKGEYDVPPPPPPGATPASPVYLVDPARLLQARQQIQIMEEQEEYQQRHPGISCVFTACVFILFLFVMHHTMVVADGGMEDYPPAPGMPPMPDRADMNTDSLTLFLFWVGTKAFMIGIPLWIMLRVASRQARREQYEAMLQGNTLDASRRMIVRMQTYGPAEGIVVPPRGINAV
ncbi:hypothetical protein CEUSTIGMA_g11747.t1 [Chlamydomonas eustigma]|uniref:RING-CH-type domain-containing protein n=1 Tax=Chlamydomonas eustigma TaxID=1157962 RepID=A0A250XMK4_9CHLO|nr:hypothetical protein CEUSTIGMA_g11747.t1 [Chlamydomonas eustigma]|eukprot:GAX84325.1 hypothetical protein CEUSTIGMA_g11747.t1 [Chlamydomonas eustigma]